MLYYGQLEIIAGVLCYEKIWLFNITGQTFNSGNKQFAQRQGKIKKADIAEACPDISISMIERTLKNLLDNGEIIRIGFGKDTSYIKK